MGYNNNHVGMHMIWNRKYGEYDDLDYYDRQAEIKMKQKKIKESIKEKELVIKKEVESLIKCSEQEKIKEETIEIDKSKKQKTTHNQTEMQYGKEELIDITHFIELPDMVMANIMIYAMKHKKDICKIIRETEELMKNDCRTNPSPESDWAWTPKLENSLVFLSILCEKLDCEVYRLFIDDIKRRKRFVYELIEDVKICLKKPYISLDRDACDLEDVQISIKDFDFEYKMAKERARTMKERMSLTLEKKKYDNGKINYAISFGNLLVRNDTKDNYIIKGAYLWEETEGALKDFIEDQISKHPEWKI